MADVSSRITVRHNGFHGWNTVTYMARAPLIELAPGVVVCEVSRRTAARINREVCGSDTCMCGEHIAFADGDRWYAPAEQGNVTGHYPQR